ncbi:FkbM family methyltransferase [Minwuia sp.]|uniref:FkbM family methyltransferase n=1 Tax=Minwuia sp. TaxID=2493630 RepID=UPI003A92F801
MPADAVDQGFLGRKRAAVIRKIKRALGIHFSSKALARNPNICLRQYARRFRSFGDLARDLTDRQKVTIVQVGANDGSANDPLGRMIAAHPERIARALLIEPQTDAFGRLSGRYAGQAHITCLNAAIDRTAGERPVYSIDKDAVEARIGQRMSDGIASFDRSHVASVLRANTDGLTDAEIDELITSEVVAVTTLAAASAEVGTDQPDILLVDTEGFDAEIMRMALEAGWRPALLQYEHKHLSPQDRREISSRLMAEGYRLWADHADVWGQRAS